MRIAIQINDPLNLGNTTYALIIECLRREHKIFIYSLNSLYHYNYNYNYHQDNYNLDTRHRQQTEDQGCNLIAKAQEAVIENNKIVLLPEKKVYLKDYDLILMRNDPPFDMRYITATYLLEKLEKLENNKTLVLNDPKAVRNFPEKIFAYPQYSFPTLISEDLEAISEFCLQYQPFIVKPLYDCGGKGILKFSQYDESIKNVLELLLVKYNTPIIIQQFSAKVLTEGDKRVVILDGEILGAFVRKSNKSFRVNMCFGGEPSITSLSPREKEISSIIAADLKAKGIGLIGLDLLDEKITEINVTSVDGIPPLERLYPGIKAAAQCVDYFERSVAGVRTVI